MEKKIKKIVALFLIVITNVAFSKTGLQNLGTGVGFTLNSTTVDKKGENYKIPPMTEFSILSLDEKNEIRSGVKLKYANSRKVDASGFLGFLPWNYSLPEHWKTSVAALGGVTSIDYTKDRNTFFQAGARGEITYRNKGYGISLGGEYLTSFTKKGPNGPNVLLSFLMFPKAFE